MFPYVLFHNKLTIKGSQKTCLPQSGWLSSRFWFSLYPSSYCGMKTSQRVTHSGSYKTSKISRWNGLSSRYSYSDEPESELKKRLFATRKIHANSQPLKFKTSGDAWFPTQTPVSVKGGYCSNFPSSQESPRAIQTTEGRGGCNTTMVAGGYDQCRLKQKEKQKNKKNKTNFFHRSVSLIKFDVSICFFS